MSQDNKKSFVMYQGNGSNNVFSVPMTKGKYGTISVAFVRRGLDQYEYNPDTWGLNGGLFAWDLSGVKVYTDTATPAIGATIYDQYGVDTGDIVTAVGGATITVNTNVYTRDTLHDVDENTVLTWTGDTLQVGDYIVIERATTRTQPFEFQNNQKHIEKSDDNLERQIQEVADKVDNALLVDPTHTIDSNKMNPVEWMETILRSVDKSVRGFRYLNGWLDYSLDDPNIADADKTWAHLLNTDNIKGIRERKEIEEGEEHRWIEYLDQNGQWQLLVDSNWDARIEEIERIADEAKQIADEAKDVADDAKEIAEGIDGKAQQALDNSVEALETAEEAKEMIQNQIIVRSATIPTPSADLVGKAYQYAGATNGTFIHGYIYECFQTSEGEFDFTPHTISCSYTELEHYLQDKTIYFNDIVSGSMTYIADGNRWKFEGKNSSDETIFIYYQFQSVWESVGFVFQGDFEDGDVVNFERTESAVFVWERIDVQPDRVAQIQALQADITDIQALIPAQASPTNQLGDKNFINSSIATNTANFIGTFNSVAELEAYSGTKTNNDYAFVIGTDSAGNTTYNRYKYNASTQQWIYEYTLNNSSFTAAQWAAINSGVTASDVSKARSAVQPSDVGNGTITITQNGETIGSFTTNQGTDVTIDIDAGGGGSGLNVGDIFLTMRNDNELNGAVECDGSTYNTTDFTGAQSIGQLLADGKVPYVSMAVYASTVASQGWCDKFGWDGAGNVQFKVPTLSAYIWQKLQTGVIGNGSRIGLQDANNNARSLYGWSGGANYPFAGNIDYNSGSLGGSADGVLKVNTDPTKSGMVAGSASDISQQRCMVQLATSATDEALETCTSVLADVATLKGYDYVSDFQAPTAQNNYTWYRKYKSGWVEQGGWLDGSTSYKTSQYNIPIAMANDHYTLTFATYNLEGAATVPANGQTTTGFMIYERVWVGSWFEHNFQGWWKVEGMAAS